MTPITPVLLCGGSGTRLWPLSRKASPKQFARLLGEDTLYQSALKRLSGPGWAAPVVVTAADYLALAHNQAEEVGCARACTLVEPAARNTAPAILAAALQIAASDPEALMLIAPSDHAIPDAAAFRAAVQAGVDAARAGDIVTFGIRPTRAETGYGWLELAADPGDCAPRPHPLGQFVEKPNAKAAAAMLAAGNYLWNAGIFLASAQTLLEAFSRHAKDLLAPVREALSDAAKTQDTVHLALDPWMRARDVSVDYAVMERAKNLCVIPFAAGWSDLGDWNAIHRETADTAPNGVVTSGAVSTIDCRDSLIRSDANGVEVVGIGLKDVVVVAMEDSVLVADRARSQEVKDAVACLKAKRAAQAERVVPSGEIFAGGLRYVSRCIEIAPHAEKRIATTSPETRWTVLAGRAHVHIGDAARIAVSGSSLCRPIGVQAIISNPSDMPLVLVEVCCTPDGEVVDHAVSRPAIAAE